MSDGIRWERLPPSEPCDSPDGHDYVDLMEGGSRIPAEVLCSRCSRYWTVLVLPREQTGSGSS